MALDSVRIKVSVDDSTLQPFIDKLDDVGRKDDENTRKAAKNAQLVEQYQKKIQESLAKTGISLESIGKANLAAFSLEELKAFYQQLEKLGNTSTTTASKFNSLGNSINQLTREMPAFAMNVQTGFMAISNNLPMLFDELNRIRQANIELTKSGQPTVSVFKQFLSSIFSVQTALSVGVTLLTIYGKELVNLVSNLFSTSSSIKSVEENQKDLNKAIEDGTKAGVKEATQLDILYRTATNLNLPLKDRNKAVEKLQEIYPSYFGNLSNEIILTGKAASNYLALRDAIFDSARAKAIQAELEKRGSERVEKELAIRENINKAQEELNRLRKTGESFIQEESVAERTRKIVISNSDLIKAQQRALTVYNKQLSDFTENAKKEDETLLNAQFEYYKKSEKLEADRIKVKTERDKKGKTDEQKLWEEALREFERISNEQERIANIEYKQFLKEGEKARQDAIKVSILQTQEGTQERLNAEIAGIRKEVEYKLTNAHLSEDARYVIIREAEEKIEKLREKYRKDEQKALEEAQKRREELLDKELKALEDAEKKKTDLRDAGVKASLDIAGSISNALFTIEQQNATDRYNRRLKQLEEEKNAELNSKTLTEKQKIAIQERFDQETEQLQKQEFERQKNFKIAQAIINTALAVTNALATGVPPFNVIQAIAIGAQGAAQIAIIENEKFAKGGLVGGKLHSQGGTVIEAEKDEYVINRKDTMENLELIESINKGKGDEYIYKKYVLPAVIGQKEAKAKESGLFAGIMDNMALNGKMFDDYYLRKAIEKSGKENAIMIVKGLKENTTLKNTRQF